VIDPDGVSIPSSGRRIEHGPGAAFVAEGASKDNFVFAAHPKLGRRMLVGTLPGMQPRDALRHYFGLDAFRSPQEAIVESVMDGRDTLVVMPTGGGKSLCYQLPALLRPGVTLVVSPLIALMKDQVDALRARGLPAGVLNSAQEASERRETLAGIRDGTLKLVYVAPERFRSRQFTESLPRNAVGLFAVDEAHCLSHWGHDFRPDYLRLNDARRMLGSPPCVALTATATPTVREDIRAQLEMANPAAFVAGFARDNLSFRVAHVSSDEAKDERLENLVRTRGTGIVYCATRKSVEAVADRLEARHGSVIRYHGGLPDEARREAQERFMNRRNDLVVATNAFGMGIDRADIRFVCHYEMPGSVEAYYQEGGRAGRDGEPSVCEMLFSFADKRVQDFFIEGNNPSKALIAEVYDRLRAEADDRREARLSVDHLVERIGRKVNPMAVGAAVTTLARQGWIERFDIPGHRVRGTRLVDPGRSGADLPLDGDALDAKAARDRERLQQVIRFAYASGCRQKWILDYFGETGGRACGRCDSCERGAPAKTPRAGVESEDVLLRKALSGVARMSRRQGRHRWKPVFGQRKIIQCLMGSRAEPLRKAGLLNLSTHGILRGEGNAYVEALFDAMQRAGLVEVRMDGEYPLLALTEVGSRVMQGEAAAQLEWPTRTAGALGAKATAKRSPPDARGSEAADAETTALYRKLAERRSELAAAKGKPVYTVFPNRVLVELANRRPTTVEDAMRIPGVGPAKAESVLPEFLAILRDAPETPSRTAP